MMKRLKYIWTMLLLVVALQAAGAPYVIDKVCLGAERVYRVDGEPGSSYLWLLTDVDGNNIVLPNPDGTLFTGTDPISGDIKQGSEISIAWKTPGIFDLASVQISIHGCDTTEQGKIEVYPHPFAFAGSNASICPGNSFPLSEATANYGTLSWSSSGTGTFNDASILNPVYTPSQTDIISGNIALTLTAEGLGNGTTCVPAVSTIFVTISNPNLLTLNNPDPVCEPKTVDLSKTIDLELSEKDLTFTYWADANATIPLPDFATVSESGVYYIKAEDSNGCSEILPVSVNIYPQPKLVITNPDPLCEPATVDLSAASIIAGSTIPPLSIISYWMDAGATLPIANHTAISTSGTYYIQIISTGNCSDIQPVTITINRLPILAITNPAPVCEPATVDLSDPLITSGSDADLNFEYYTDVTATILSDDYKAIAKSETYYIKAINSAGCATIKAVTVIVHPKPVLVVTDPEDVCEPATVDLSKTFSPIPDLTYTYWTDENATFELTGYTAVADGGTYYIKATNPVTECFTIEPVHVIVNPVPQLVINQPKPVCEPQTVDITVPEITLGSVISATSELTYWLDDLATMPLLSPETIDKTGKYYIKLKSGFECFVIEAVSVTVNPQPKFITKNPDVVCEPDVVDLSKTIEADPGQTLTYTWWDDEDATIQLAGSIVSAVGKRNYFIRAENEFGCFTIKPVEVIINPQPVLSIINPPAECFPATVDLTANTVVDKDLLAPASKLTYWLDALATEALQNPAAIDQSNIYYIKLEAGVGCFDIKPVEVTINQLPVVKITDPDPICEPATINLELAAITSGSTIGLNWSYWADPEAKTPLVNYSAVSATGTYYLMGTNPLTGCSVIEKVNVVVNKPVTPGFNIITDICLNSAPTALPLVSIEGISGTWAPSAINTTIKTTTTYTFTPDAGQCALSYKTDITVGDGIIPAFTALGPYCYNAIPDNLPLISNNGITGSWDPSSISTTKVGETVYTFTPSDGKCAKSTTLIIIVYDRIFASITTENESEPGLTDGRITVYDETGGSSVYEYRLDNGIWQPQAVFENLTPGTYEVSIRDKQVPACPVSLGSVTIYPSGNIIVSAVVTHIECFGDETGEIRYEKALGGSGSFEYNIGNGWVEFIGSFIRPNLTAGKYIFLLRDAGDHAKQISLEKIIDQPNFWSVNLTAQPAGINRANLTASIAGSGGTPKYDYLWSDGQKTATAYNLNFGIHTITVTDAKGCIIKQPYNVGFLVSAEIVTPILCPGDKATVRIKAWAGVGPYKLEMNGQKFANEIDIQIGAGDHSFIVEDYFGVKALTKVEIKNVLPVMADITANPVSCSGINDGEIIISNTTGGTGNSYEYRINNGNWTQIVTSPVTIGGLYPNKYHVELREIGSNCTYPKWDITIEQALPIALAAVGINAVCFGDNGSIRFTFTNVRDDFYTITHSTGSFNTVEIRNNSAIVAAEPGEYKNLKLIAHGCSSADGVDVKVEDGLEIIVTASVTKQPDCYDPKGTIEVTVPLGENYLYSFDGGAYGMESKFEGLAPETTHTVRVKDISTGCESEATLLTIDPLPTPPAAPQKLYDIVECITDPAQTLDANDALVMVPGVSIIWYDALVAGNVVKEPILNTVDTKTYFAEANNVICASVGRTPVSLTLNPAPAVLVSQNPYEVCAESTVQTIDARTVVTVQPGVTLNWYDTAVGGTKVLPVLNKIGTKIYYAETFNSQCPSPVRTKITLTIHPLLNTPEAVITRPTCTDENGMIEITRPIGNNIEYSLDGGTYQASELFSNLSSKQYNIKARNKVTGCESVAKFVVPEALPLPVMKKVEVEDCVCYGDSGHIDFEFENVDDGTYVIVYLTGKFQNVKVVDGKASIKAVAGKYDILAIEANGCTSNQNWNVEIKQPDRIVASYEITEIDLKSDQKGEIDLTISGGTGNYNTIWEPNASIQFAGSVEEDIVNLRDGDYLVTITDENGCPQSLKITIPKANLPPDATNDEFHTICGRISGNLLFIDNGSGKDSDPDGDEIVLDPKPIGSPVSGLILNPDGSFEYQAAPGFSGDIIFGYIIFDEKNNPSIPATVTIHVISDFDGDGLADIDDPDADGDGILNIYEGGLTTDTDGDGTPNHLDIDADGDGIPDNIEAQGWANYIHPSNIDVNNNGVDDAYDKFQFTTEIVPIDTDGDGIPDFLDADSDNDGVPDYIEGHDLNADGKPDRFAFGRDSDGDGLDDAYDTVVNECNALGNAVGSNAPMQDFDGDGMPDWRDEDDDDDGYLTKFEDLNADGDWSNDDLDYDGHPEYLDFGRDCDLFIPDAFSPNGDNIHDYFQIYCINHFPDAKMYIFDQLGNKLFEKAHYGNLDHWLSHDRAWWNGKPEYGPSKARNEVVPPGTYYYVLDLGNGEVKKSFVFISY